MVDPGALTVPLQARAARSKHRLEDPRWGPAASLRQRRALPRYLRAMTGDPPSDLEGDGDLELAVVLVGR
ncbi:MAG: hypothetical protein EA397_17895 [Deltaproteobacteria bacterium]|nr:MAG: hypothetical protein EA397_17895 [Deltaproteobacteria bacterium]